MQAEAFESEIEHLLDRQRSALQGLWASGFLLLAALVAASHLLVPLGAIGWGAFAAAVLVGFVLLRGAVGSYRAAHEAVQRRIARR